MNMIKSISKRTLALILSMLMLLSSGIVGAVAANVEVAATGVNMTGGEKLYLTPNANWKIDGARFAAYFYNSSGNTWASMTAVSGETDLYEVTVPSGDWANVIFCRMNGSASENNWDNKWNQTSDLTYDGTKNHYTVTENTWDSGGGTWSTYTPPATKHTVTINNNKTPSTSTSYTQIFINGTQDTSITIAKTMSFEVEENSTIKVCICSPTNNYISAYKVTTGGNTYNYIDDSTKFATDCWYKTSYETTVTGAITIDLEHSENPDVTTESASNGTISLSASGANYTYKDPITGTATANDDYYVSRIYAVKASDDTTVVAEETNSDINVKTLSATVTQVTEDIVFKAEFTAKTTYTVTFVDHDGTVLDTQTVVSGKSATAPADPTRTGYTFTGWDVEFTNVTSNLTVTAQYAQDNYTIKFLDHDGTELLKYTAVYGQAITYPDDPTREGYTFTEWTPSVVDPVTGEATYTAQYSINSYDFNITYDSDMGTVTAESDVAISAGDKVKYNTSVTISATPGTDYNFIGWTIVNNGVTTTSADKTTTLVVKGDVSITANFVAKEYRTISFSAKDEKGNVINDGTFSVTGETVTDNGDGTFQIESGNAFDVTVAAPDTYYVASVNGTAYDETTLSKTVSFDASYSAADIEIPVVFTLRPTYTVTVVNSDDNMGTLNATTKGGFYKNATYKITPTAKDGFIFNGWDVVGTSNYTVDEDGVITITVDANVTVTANWDTKKSFKVTLKAPASMGWASATGTDASTGAAISFDTKGTQNWAEVAAGTVLTFTSTIRNNSILNGWDIDGNYSLVSNTDGQLVITVNGEVTVTAQYKASNKTFYVIDAANWSQCRIIYYTPAYPTGYHIGMSYDSSTDKYSYTVPSDTYKVVFYQYNESDGATGTITDFSKYDTWNNSTGAYSLTSSSSGDTITTYKLTGDLNLNLENYGDGNHIGTVEVASGTSVTVYPYGSDGKYWNFASSIDDTSANVTESSTKGTGVTVDLGTNANGVTVDFIFNPTNGTLSWTVTQMKETVNVEVNYGMSQNEADKADGSDIGKTYFQVDGSIVYSFTEGEGNKAKIAKGEKATVYTSINQGAWVDGTPIHRVEGWVIDGTEFIPATSNDGKVFYGTHAFDKDCTVTPIYFHTDAWLKANSVSTVTVFAVLDTKTDTTPTHHIEEWQQGISSYTWFYPSGTTTSKYCQFDTWTGQYMIPVGNNVFKTYVETVGAGGDSYKSKEFYKLPVSGITFTNVMMDTTDTSKWVQAYDYYEFKSLIDDGRFNITFVLRNHNTKINKDNGANSASITTGNYNWMDYIDYSGNVMDIHRNVIKVKSTTTTDNTLYILREGPYIVDQGDAKGQFYLYANVFDSTGTRIGRYLTYELVDPESQFFKDLKAKETAIQATDPEFTYTGGTVKISYEAMNTKDSNGTTQATRYDGEWYGDLTDTTKVKIDVLVGFTTDEGKTITVEDVSTNDWGTATVNGAASAEVSRGTNATLLASEKSGYKFVGWYNTVKDADGNISATTLITEEYSKPQEASIAATYVAVYRARTGGEFDVLNLKYGGDVSDPSVPYAHGGESYRFVEVVHKHVNGTTSTTSYPKTADGISLENVLEGDTLEITIYTKAYYPEDTFYAWYMEVRDENGKIVNFEEVAVSENFVGSKEEVSFTFEYTVKKNDNGITVYSDIYHKEITKDIIYIYQDRYDNTKQYVKTKYTLEGNELLTGVPSEETVIKYAPWVEDLYKDTSWVFAEDKFTADSWTLVATQAPTVYTVNVFVGEDSKDTYEGVYDTLLEVLATSIDANATNNGFWYDDCGTEKGTYDDGDVILAYGTYYGLRIKKNADIRYAYGDEALKFEVVLDELIYGREQSGENGAVDIIYVDFMTSVHVPYFKGQTLPNGEKITEVVYGEDTITSANSPVTFDTLEKYGYKVNFGVLLEQVGSFKVGENQKYADFDSALAAAQAAGYGSELTNKQSDLELVVGKQGFGTGSAESQARYYYTYDLTGEFISNKNRYPFTIPFTNNVSYRGRFYNAYSYVTITYVPEGQTESVTEYYFSDLQTLNIYEAGTNDSSAYNS